MLVKVEGLGFRVGGSWEFPAYLEGHGGLSSLWKRPPSTFKQASGLKGQGSGGYALPMLL